MVWSDTLFIYGGGGNPQPAAARLPAVAPLPTVALPSAIALLHVVPQPPPKQALVPSQIGQILLQITAPPVLMIMAPPAPHLRPCWRCPFPFPKKPSANMVVVIIQQQVVVETPHQSPKWDIHDQAIASKFSGQNSSNGAHLILCAQKSISAMLALGTR